MMEWIQEMPLLPAVAFLYVVIWCRAGATYLVGRGARRAANRGRVADFLESPSVTRATGLIHRWGAPVVALSFLTVGFQTAVNAAAGLVGMPAKRYLPALAIGGLAWAFIYATVGLVAFMVWFELFLVSPWGAVAVLALLVALIAVLLRHRRRTRWVSGTGGVSRAETSRSVAEEQSAELGADPAATTQEPHT
ncbi:DedA family protein [Brachybacterium vulturis]|uniref:DedA family protein n=1 Tax=Brachybacterium vulturis TaxID=2017484 RepID=UPI0037355FB8